MYVLHIIEPLPVILSTMGLNSQSFIFRERIVNPILMYVWQVIKPLSVILNTMGLNSLFSGNVLSMTILMYVFTVNSRVPESQAVKCLKKSEIMTEN